MRMQLYAHPFSSCCQNALIAFYENGIPFEFRLLAPDNMPAVEEHAALWPLRRMPVLADEARPYRHFFPLGAPDRD
jgi:glutathione S-transferase